MTATLAPDAIAAVTPTVASCWFQTTGQPISDALLEWPADLFAFTHVILEQAQAFRFALSPPGAERWPPIPPEQWSALVSDAARAWRASIDEGSGSLPPQLAEQWGQLLRDMDRPVEELAQGQAWPLCQTLLTLHAIADEACAVLFGLTDGDAGTSCGYRARSRELLARTGTLARIDPHGLRVLPKVRTPRTGRAPFSRYASIVRGNIDVRWHKLPYRSPGAGPETEHINALLLPWPLRVRASDFRPVPGSVHWLGDQPSGFFEFAPSEGLDLDLVDRVLVAARDEVDSVDVVVLPESAIDASEVESLEALLDRHGVIGLRAGVRERSVPPARFGGNWVHIGVNPRLDEGGPLHVGEAQRWLHLRQNKHHRWSLDQAQIDQYNLGAALHPHVQWWEAMDVPRLTVQFVEGGWGSTMAHVVCEDLTQDDEVSGVTRSVGPTLVVAYLLDGPQLASRWTARYAGVLADDPGSAVLTLSSYGMVSRSRPHGHAASPVIGLWKDGQGGTREIPLDPDAHGVLLTIGVDHASRRSADGRLPVDTGFSLFDVGVNQIHAAPTPSSAASATPTMPAAPPALEVDDISILTGWAEGIAEALDYAPDKALPLLDQARDGTFWRKELGLSEPSPRLQEAFDAINETLTAATRPGKSPTLAYVLLATQNDEPNERPVDQLARRVLRATLDQLRSRHSIPARTAAQR
jgi:hypothetical protein